MSRLVLFVLTMFCVVACAGKNDSKGNEIVAIGANTKTGKTLLSGSWCKKVVTDSTGLNYVHSLRFLQDASFERGTYLMNKDGSLGEESTSKGTWALVAPSVLLTENDKTVNYKLNVIEPQKDGAKCLELGDGDALENYCVCDLL